MKRPSSLVLLILLAVCAPATQAKSSTKEPVVARVNGTPISQARFERALAQAKAMGAADSEALRAAIRNQLIARELFRQQAEKQKLHNDPQVLEARDNAMIQLNLQREIKPAPVSLIEVADAALADTLAAQLKAEPARFAELAQTHSSAPSAQRGGELDWVSFPTPVQEGKTQGLPLPIAQALAALGAGQVTERPIAFNGRYYLIKLDEVRPTQVPDYAKASGPLRAMLERRALEQATADLVARLIKNAKIEMRQ